MAREGFKPRATQSIFTRAMVQMQISENTWPIELFMSTAAITAHFRIGSVGSFVWFDRIVKFAYLPVRCTCRTS